MRPRSSKRRPPSDRPSASSGPEIYHWFILCCLKFNSLLNYQVWQCVVVWLVPPGELRRCVGDGEEEDQVEEGVAVGQLAGGGGGGGGLLAGSFNLRLQHHRGFHRILNGKKEIKRSAPTQSLLKCPPFLSFRFRQPRPGSRLYRTSAGTGIDGGAVRERSCCCRGAEELMMLMLLSPQPQLKRLMRRRRQRRWTKGTPTPLTEKKINRID